MRILALDLGKYKTVFLDSVVGTDKREYGKVDMTPQAIHDLLLARSPDRLVLEVGPAAGWVCDLARAMNIPVQVANTSDERWLWKNVKKKTDRADVLKLTQMSEAGSLPTVHMPQAGVRQWRSLIEYRQALVARRTAVKNSIRAIYDRQGLKLPAAHRAWTESGIRQLKTDARPLEECPDLELWRGQLHQELDALESIEEQIRSVEDRLDRRAAAEERVQRLQQAPCVGKRLSEVVVAVLDEPKRFDNAKQVSAYAGLSPRQWQSGQSLREGHISHRGNPVLRALLVQIAWMGVRTRTWMADVYERVRRGSDKRKKIAIVAVARRLLVRLWAMLRDQAPWKEQALPREAAPA